jgi:hypothetical protein
LKAHACDPVGDAHGSRCSVERKIDVARVVDLSQPVCPGLALGRRTSVVRASHPPQHRIAGVRDRHEDQIAARMRNRLCLVDGVWNVRGRTVAPARWEQKNERECDRRERFMHADRVRTFRSRSSARRSEVVHLGFQPIDNRTPSRDPFDEDLDARRSRHQTMGDFRGRPPRDRSGDVARDDASQDVGRFALRSSRADLL